MVTIAALFFDLDLSFNAALLLLPRPEVACARSRRHVLFYFLLPRRRESKTREELRPRRPLPRAAATTAASPSSSPLSPARGGSASLYRGPSH